MARRRGTARELGLMPADLVLVHDADREDSPAIGYVLTGFDQQPQVLIIGGNALHTAREIISPGEDFSGYELWERGAENLATLQVYVTLMRVNANLARSQGGPEVISTAELERGAQGPRRNIY